jgi:hypothetical protein
MFHGCFVLQVGATRTEEEEECKEGYMFIDYAFAEISNPIQEKDIQTYYSCFGVEKKIKITDH